MVANSEEQIVLMPWFHVKFIACNYCAILAGVLKWLHNYFRRGFVCYRYMQRAAIFWWKIFMRRKCCSQWQRFVESH